MGIRSLLVLTLVLAATAVSAGAQEPPNPTDPAIASGSAQRALDGAKARWRKAAIRSYRFDARRICFCPTSGWHAISVRNGVPSKATHGDVKQIATIPRLFAVIERAIRRKAHRLTVTYGAYGVPHHVYIDQVENVIDEEQTFDIRRVRRR